MLFLTLPLALLLSVGLSFLPGALDMPARGVRALSTVLNGHAGSWAAVLTLLLVTALLCLLSALLESVHPLLTAVLIAPLCRLPLWLRQALAKRAELEEGACETDAQRAEYERQVRGAIYVLAHRCAHALFMPLLLIALLMPVHLGAAAGWALCVLYALREEVPRFEKVCAALSHAGEAVFITLVIPTAALCGTELGMAARAHAQGARAVLLSAVGVDPLGKAGHAPVTGDISQACLCVCVAGVLLLVLATVPVLLLLSQLGISL